MSYLADNVTYIVKEKEKEILRKVTHINLWLLWFHAQLVTLWGIMIKARYCCRASAGSTHTLERFEIFWFDGSIGKCLAAAPVFLFRAIRHFVLFSCEFKICAEVVVHRMFAVFLNSLNGKNSSRTIVRDIFSFFFILGFKISYREYFLSHRLLSRKSGL